MPRGLSERAFLMGNLRLAKLTTLLGTLVVATATNQAEVAFTASVCRSPDCAQGVELCAYDPNLGAVIRWVTPRTTPGSMFRLERAQESPWLHASLSI